MSYSGIKILIADDEDDVLEFLRYTLEKEGFQVISAHNGMEAIQKARAEKPHLIVLDVMMPKLDGFEACRELRSMPEFRNTLITFLTARQEDAYQINGFENGADDYITKPVKPRLFISRIQALLRRLDILKQDQKLLIGKIELDKEQYLVSKEGRKISLPRKEFELLSLFASRPGKVFKRDEILNNVWGVETEVGDRTIDVHIRRLREKLGDEHFITIKGVGYKFEG